MRGRREWWIGGATVAVLVVALVVWSTARGEDDPIELLRESPGVASAEVDRNDLELRLQPDASLETISAAVEQVPDDLRRGTLRVGAVVVTFRSASELRATVPAVAALAALDAPAEAIELRTRSNSVISAWVERRDQAAPLALQIVDALPASVDRPAGTDGLDVRVRDEARGEPIVRIDSSRAFGQDTTRSVLAASTRVPNRDPVVRVLGSGAELRLRATGLNDTRRAWDDAVAALRLPDDQRNRVRLAVVRGGGPDGNGAGTTALRGTAAERPDRAVALLRAFGSDARQPYATADLRYASAAFPGAGSARAAAQAADARDVEDLEVRWSSGSERSAWLGGGVGNSGRDETRIRAAPAEVARLTSGVVRARQAGIPALRWTDGPRSDMPRLSVARPEWMDDDVELAAQPDQLRRLARAIRTIGWTGPASFVVILGPGSCADNPTAQSAARIESSATGRARAVRAGAACADPAALRVARQAWNATAD